MNKPYLTGDIYFTFSFNLSYIDEMEDNERKEVLRISDVSADKSKVEELVDLCNKEQLEPVHIYDVIEDFLYS